MNAHEAAVQAGVAALACSCPVWTGNPEDGPNERCLHDDPTPAVKDVIAAIAMSPDVLAALSWEPLTGPCRSTGKRLCLGHHPMCESAAVLAALGGHQ